MKIEIISRYSLIDFRFLFCFFFATFERICIFSPLRQKKNKLLNKINVNDRMLVYVSKFKLCE